MNYKNIAQILLRKHLGVDAFAMDESLYEFKNEKNSAIQSQLLGNLTRKVCEIDFTREEKKAIVKDFYENTYTVLAEGFTVDEVVDGLSNGMRIHKAIKRKWDDTQRRCWAANEYDEVRNSFSLKGTLYFTIDPREILTCSVNSYGWSTCYAPTSSYSGMPALIVKEPNVAMFFVSTGVDVNGIHDKKWRAMCPMTDTSAFLTSSYPFDLPKIAIDKIHDFLGYDYIHYNYFDHLESVNCLEDDMSDGVLFYYSTEPRIKLTIEKGCCLLCGKENSDYEKMVCKECRDTLLAKDKLIDWDF